MEIPNSKTTVFVVAGLVIGTALLVYTTKKGKNPFAIDAREAWKPYESDREKRDAVLKNGYSEKKLQAARAEGDFDAIVIGSGIGGLTTAAILARAGKRVCILEQHDQLGGCCHSFHEKGFEFDTGIHYVGEMRNNTAFRFLMDQLSCGHLKWADVRDDFDTVVLVDCPSEGDEALRAIQTAVTTGQAIESRQVSMMSSEEATIGSLLEAFPAEEGAIRSYFALLARVRKATVGFVSLKSLPRWMGRLSVYLGFAGRLEWFKYASVSTTQVLLSLTSNPTLRAVLGYNFGDYGTLPRDAPFSMHAVLNNHFLKGVSFPTGGSSEIALHIVPPILRAGGAAFVRAEVDHILLEGGRAVGVQMKRGGVVKAPIVISAAGIYNTYDKLLPPSLQPLLAPCMEHVRHGMGGISVYIGLRGTAEELGLSGKHFWAFWTPRGSEDLDLATQTYLNRDFKSVTAAPLPLLFVSFPSAKGALGDLIWSQTLSLFPHLRDRVEYFNVGTPVTNNHYLASSRGEMYGADHDLHRFTPGATVGLRAETDVPGLYLSGQDIFSCGFAGATFGGLLCASSVLGRNVYEDLLQLKTRSPPSIQAV